MLLKGCLIIDNEGHSLKTILNSYTANTLVYRIDVHARLLILRKNSPLHSLILVCMFIDFEKIFPPARLFFPAQQSYFGLHVY